MGIDLDKMRQKHSALTNKGGDSSDNFWKPEDGTQVVRLVCPADGDPFREFYFHYGLGAEGRTTVLSPRTFGETILFPSLEPSFGRTELMRIRMQPNAFGLRCVSSLPSSCVEKKTRAFAGGASLRPLMRIC